MHQAAASAPRQAGTLSHPGAALKALWYDGLSSRPRRALVMMEPHAQGPQLVIQPLEAGADGITLGHWEVQWPQTFGKGDPEHRLVVDLGPHGTLEVQGQAQWHAAYRAAGGKRSVVERLQTSWRLLLLFLIATILVVFLFVRYGTPWAATHIARFVPLGWEDSWTQQSMQQLDRYWLEPSTLPEPRRQALRQRFDAMVQDLPEELRRYRRYQPEWRLEFRAGIGPNAFALPGGLVLMTDEMVAVADRQQLGDDALMGVIAHEIGHVVHRHSSRALIEQGVLNATLSVAMGDVSGWVALSSTVLTSMAYSRSHEREADCFALALMRHQGLNTTPMAQMFMRLTRSGARARQGDDASPQSGWDWLSTHPNSAMRIGQFAAGEAARCDMATGRLR